MEEGPDVPWNTLRIFWMKKDKVVAWKHQSLCWLSCTHKHPPPNADLLLRLFLKEYINCAAICSHLVHDMHTHTFPDRHAWGPIMHIYHFKYTDAHVLRNICETHKSWLMCVESERRRLSLWYLCICVSITGPPTQPYLHTILQT